MFISLEFINIYLFLQFYLFSAEVEAEDGSSAGKTRPNCLFSKDLEYYDGIPGSKARGLFIQNRKNVKTRPDTRPTPDADGWAGAEMRVFPLSDSIITDRQTD